MLQEGALLAQLLVGAPAVVLDLGAELPRQAALNRYVSFSTSLLLIRPPGPRRGSAPAATAPPSWTVMAGSRV